MGHIGGTVTLKMAVPGAKVAIGVADEGYVSGRVHHPVYPGFRDFLLRVAGAIMSHVVFPIVILLKDGDRIEGLLCVVISGHTPGSIGLYGDRTKTFFPAIFSGMSGDPIWKDWTPSPWASVNRENRYGKWSHSISTSCFPVMAFRSMTGLLKRCGNLPLPLRLTDEGVNLHNNKPVKCLNRPSPVPGKKDQTT